jgi:serine/threonine-protein kinase
VANAEQAPKSPVAEGEVIAGKYKVEKMLGVGGMGVVVAAMHIHLRQRVAIKFLLPDASAELVTRFMREARASAKLKSEHIARVIDVAELDEAHGRAPYMVMEYLDGSDLSRVIRKRGALPIDDAVDYLLQACEAIAEAHTVGIVHRDLKPANLFLTKAADGSASVKVLDFGISKDTSEEVGEEEMALTRTTAVLGSPYYMAPEQMRSTRTVDARADIWSIGVILYQLVTKAVPFKAGSFVELALMVVNDDPQPPSALRPDLPPAIEGAILRCIRKNPAERFANVSELAAVLAPFGRAGAVGSAERIARTQGAPMPLVERPSGVSIAPPPPSAVSGHGSGQQSLGSALSSGPSINLPTPPPGSQSTGDVPRTPAPSTQPSPRGAPAEEPSRVSILRPANATKQGIGPAAGPPSAVSVSPIVPVTTGRQTYDGAASESAPPGAPVRGSLAEALGPSPSVPPPASITGSSTGKEANAATASTWAGAPAASAQPRHNGARKVVGAGFLLGALAVAGTVVVLRTQTNALGGPHAASTALPIETSTPLVTATATAVIAQEPPQSPPRPPPSMGAVDVTAGPVAPALGAPVSTTMTSPGGRTPPKGSAAPHAPTAVAPPAPATVATPPPGPTAAVPVAPPPPPPPPVPTVKKSVLDIDIK